MRLCSNRAFVAATALLLSINSGAAASEDNGFRVTIRSKYFFTDPGSHKAHFAIKVTIDNSPEAGFVLFHAQGLDSDGFVLADLLMHVMKVNQGTRDTVTKRFEIDEGDYRRIGAWRLAEAKALSACEFGTIESIFVKALPDSDDASIGTVLIRSTCVFDQSSGAPGDEVGIQALDEEGFEICHFQFDRYDCTAEHSSSPRRGRWAVNGGKLEFDGFKWVFRPRDFSALPRIRNWSLLPIDRNEANIWEGDSP